MSNRVVEPEFLDHLPGDDPEAIRSRGDLRRLNWWMRNERHVLGAIQQLGQPPRTLVEAGSGDGTFVLSLARRLQWKHPVRLTLLDMQPVITKTTLNSLDELGWNAEVRTETIQAWLKSPQLSEVDLILGNLFWHHFSDDDLREIFFRSSRLCKAFIACEPRRWLPAQLTTRFLWVIGCSRVTSHDARVSVNAGFRGTELSALWPKTSKTNLKEYAAGWASHVFIAERQFS